MLSIMTTDCFRSTVPFYRHIFDGMVFFADIAPVVVVNANRKFCRTKLKRKMYGKRESKRKEKKNHIRMEL